MPTQQLLHSRMIEVSNNSQVTRITSIHLTSKLTEAELTDFSSWLNLVLNNQITLAREATRKVINGGRYF